MIIGYKNSKLLDIEKTKELKNFQTFYTFSQNFIFLFLLIEKYHKQFLNHQKLSETNTTLPKSLIAKTIDDETLTENLKLQLSQFVAVFLKTLGFTLYCNHELYKEDVKEKMDKFSINNCHKKCVCINKSKSNGTRQQSLRVF